MATTKVKPIRPLLGFKSATDAQVQSRATAVLTGLTGNAHFPTPPVDLAALKTAIDTFTAGIAEALDGSMKAIAKKNKDRAALTKMLKQLAVYVEANCNDDLAIFTTSGFQPASTTRTPPQPLTQPIVKKLEHGSNSGQLIARIAAIAKAKSYDVRHAPLANGVPGQWTTTTVTTVKKGILIDGLTPGTVYAFQVRALGRVGYTDYSDSATMMCT
jgi:hypothetical protein